MSVWLSVSLSVGAPADGAACSLANRKVSGRVVRDKEVAGHSFTTPSCSPLPPDRCYHCIRHRQQPPESTPHLLHTRCSAGGVAVQAGSLGSGDSSYLICQRPTASQPGRSTWVRGRTHTNGSAFDLPLGTYSVAGKVTADLQGEGFSDRVPFAWITLAND